MHNFFDVYTQSSCLACILIGIVICCNIGVVHLILCHNFHFNRQHGVSDKDASVRKFLQREGEQYRMDAEVKCGRNRDLSQMPLCMYHNIF